MDITNKLDKYVGEDEYQYQLTEGKVKDIFRQGAEKLKKIPWVKYKRTFMDHFAVFADFVQKAGLEDEVLWIINKNMGTRFSSLDDIINLKLLKNPEPAYVDGYDSGPIYEGKFSNWWDNATKDLSKNISLIPFQRSMHELSRVMNGNGNVMLATFYTLIWIMVATGKIVKGKLLTAKGK